jgi:2Fe-2S ferredoxin
VYKVTFIEHDGEIKTVGAEDGQTLMEAATSGGVRGILAECGGFCVCGTCHCFIDERWLAATGTPNNIEKMLLEFSEHQRSNSRLSCQLQVTQAIDGMVVHLPPSQP